MSNLNELPDRSDSDHDIMIKTSNNLRAANPLDPPENAMTVKDTDQAKKARLARTIIDTIGRKLGPGSAGVPAHKVILEDSFYNSFGSAVVMSTGRIVIGFRRGTTHSANGDIISRYSDDNGNNFSDMATVHDAVTGGNDARDVSLSILTIDSVETVRAIYSVEIVDGSGDYEAYYNDSIDGATWGASVNIPEMDDIFSTAPVVDTGSEWLMAGYVTGATPEPAIFRSTDEGDTWVRQYIEDTFTLSTQPSADDSFIVGEMAYKWVASGATLREINIGVDLDASKAAFVDAINGDDGINDFNNLWDAEDFIVHDSNLKRVHANEMGFIVDDTYVYIVHRHGTDSRKWGLSRAPVGSATTANWEVLPVTLDKDCPVGTGCRPNITKVGDTFYMVRRTDNTPTIEGWYLVASKDLQHWYLDTNVDKDFLNRFMYGEWLEINGTTCLFGAFEQVFNSTVCGLHLLSLSKIHEQQQVSMQSVMSAMGPNPIGILENLDLPNGDIRPLRYLVEDPCTSSVSPGFEWAETGTGATAYGADSLARRGKLMTTGATINNVRRTRAINRQLTGGSSGTKTLFVLGNHADFDQERINWHVGWSRQTSDEVYVNGVGIFNDTDSAPTEFSWISYDSAGTLFVESTGITYSALSGREAYAVLVDYYAPDGPWSSDTENRITVSIYKVSNNGFATLLGKSTRTKYAHQNDQLRATVQTLTGAARAIKLLYVGFDASII